MQNSSIVTRCPQCQTAFRVTHAQLNIAKGAVRCGSCLSIFRAMDHIDDKDEPKQQKATEKKAARKIPTTATTVAKTKPLAPEPTKAENAFSLDIDEELLQDNDAIDNEIDQDSDDFYFYDKETPPTNKSTSIFGTTTTKPVTEATQEKADESWALDILAELEEEEDDQSEALLLKLAKRKQAPAAEVENTSVERVEDDASDDTLATEKITPLHNKVTQEPSDSSAANDSHDNELAFTATDNSFDDAFENTIGYEELIDEERLEQPVEAKQVDLDTDTEAEDLEFYYDESFEVSSEGNAETQHSAEPLHEDFDEDLESLISDEQIDDAMDATPSYKQELQGMIKGIQSAPVEMGAYEQGERRKWLWRIAFVTVALLLIIQVIYFRFDDLSKHPSYRPILTQVCNVVGCQMPELVAVDKIRSNNLIVRSHPTATNALLVDVILVNNANFAQPYPALSLEFSTLGDSLLAASKIQPNQYLRGELAGSRLMPVNQPIQVSLSIQDPGSDAVNYRLNILSAAP